MCLENCPIPCIQSLIEDYKKAGGVCPGSSYYEYPDSDTQTCVFDGVDAVSTIIQQGLCSEATESLLREEECITYVFNNKLEVWRTIDNLVLSMCSRDTWDAFAPSSINKRRILGPLRQRDNDRLTPIHSVVNNSFGEYASGTSDLKNTRNRYSWICSLRRRQDNQHLCGVTLLSMPPSKTIMISSAHCVTVCRNEAQNRIVPNCCCKNIGGQDCTDDSACGEDAAIVNLTGEDAEIICGEWETGNKTASESGEEYNIILPIKNITRHPDYAISRGDGNSQFVANDLAVFFVYDEELKKSEDGIVPICLPENNDRSQTNAVHSGWSSPPPLKFLNQSLPLYVPYYESFFKQWHYSMNITKCQDPNQNFKFATNSSYPPGVVCAIEKFGEFCPSSGESGSPLMVQEDNKFLKNKITSRYYKTIKKLIFG